MYEEHNPYGAPDHAAYSTAYGGAGYPMPYPSPTRLRQSGLGIAALIMGVLIGLAQFGTIVFAGVMEASTEGGLPDDSPILALVGLLMLATLFGNIVGVVLAGVGLAQRDRAKTVSILGLTFNGLGLLGMGSLIVLGLLLG